MRSTKAFSPRPRKLTISQFSALDDVAITLGALTLITGPQASGKSLICKLTYFFQEVFGQVLRSVQQSQTFQQFEKSEAKRFQEWFPASAWGSRKFSIRYSVDGFDIQIDRSGGRGLSKSTVQITYSEAIKALYEQFYDALQKGKSNISGDDELAYIRSDQNYRLQIDFHRAVSAQFGPSSTSDQTYVPASRAFFTTIGKAMAAFEHAQVLDPITKSFGRLYIALFERLRHGFPLSYRYSGSANSGSRYRVSTMSSIFGGKPRMEREEMVLEAPDGRLIPLNALSSGQQELLPLWLSIDYFESVMGYQDNTSGSNFLYIEEPEAHLFPHAQSEILEVLVSMMRKNDSRSQMVLTTHSPYLLAKANNLLLAGQIGFRKRLERQKRVEQIIPKSRWLFSTDVTCYGLKDGKCFDLIGSDGLISTDYIDEVSQEIVDELQNLYDAVN
jgi:hypothetical protein